MDEPPRHTIVACVQAASLEAARKAVAVDWPETDHEEWRFDDERASDYAPPSDRFPLSGWMRKRFGK